MSLKKQLRHQLKKHPATRYVVGFSGGRDSHVLLDCLHQLRQSGQLNTPIIAIHVNHHLQPVSDDWSRHCQRICDAYGVKLITETVSVKPQKGESIEAFAREQRYALIEKYLTDGDIFLSAHHQRDQAETFLLQLMRGAGLDGLQAMPEIKPLGAGQYLRPLLGVAYEDIVQYAQQQQLNFITDKSNDDTRFNRNYIRHEVLPVLKQRFPQAEQSIARSADWLGEVATPNAPDKLYLPILRNCPLYEQKRQIRDYCKSKTGQTLSKTQTDYILNHHLTAGADKQPLLKVGQYMIRRYNEELVVTLDSLPCGGRVVKFSCFARELDNPAQQGEEDYQVPPYNNGVCSTKKDYALFFLDKTYFGKFTWQTGQGGLAAGQYQLQPLQGSMRFCPQTRSHSTTVKKLLHEAGIAPWLRPFWLGLFDNNELVAIPNVGVAKKTFQKNDNAMMPLWIIEKKFVRL